MEKALYELRPYLCIGLGLVLGFFTPPVAILPCGALVVLGLLISRMRYVYRRDLQRSIKECKPLKHKSF